MIECQALDWLDMLNSRKPCFPDASPDICTGLPVCANLPNWCPRPCCRRSATSFR
jgi:hypothetical protein